MVDGMRQNRVDSVQENEIICVGISPSIAGAAAVG